MTGDGLRIGQYFYDGVRIKPSKLKDSKTSIALFNLEVYLNGVVMQWDRIAEIETAWASEAKDFLMKHPSPPSSPPPFDFEEFRQRAIRTTLMMIDAHLYVNCWDKVRVHFSRVAKDVPTARPFFARLSEVFKDLPTVRNFYEHFHQEEIQGQGYGWSSDGSFTVSYLPKGETDPSKIRRKQLGLSEITELRSAYGEMMEALRQAPDLWIPSPSTETTQEVDQA